ncbi:formamidopyrimidine-DNA glycosylase [bacterium]|nr:formamidopyrimidine-DNA glycosylase [bacterium]
MPEYPDIELYLSALRPRLQGRKLLQVQRKDPFVLRTVEPPLSELVGREVTELRRLGKRIVLGFPPDLFLIIHLMIAGRFRWNESKMPGGCLICWKFESGWLGLSEAGTKRRAKIHLVRGETALAEHDPGGVEIFSASLEQFRALLASRRHTLKRALTDPTIFSGIGNAYSDEILLRARLSPVRLTTQLSPEESQRLFETIREQLSGWRDALQAEWGEKFPTTVTAFHANMAAHGKYQQPCPQCGNPIQRIRYAENETNYCAICQTGGKLLADRSLSRLLKSDWPKTLEEMEEKKRPGP